jgi:hypothetical protein
MFAFVSANARTTATSFQMRKNGAAGAHMYYTIGVGSHMYYTIGVGSRVYYTIGECIHDSLFIVCFVFLHSNINDLIRTIIVS